MRAVAPYLTLAVLACMSLATLVSIRNYSAARSLLEADPPSALLAAPQRTGIAGLKSVWFTSRDRLRLSAWYARSTNGAAIIVTHGTNSDRSSLLPELRVLSGAGYGVLAFDWPGLGESQGTIRWDLARQAIDRFDLVVIGDCWGDGPYAPGARPGRTPLGFVFELAHGEPTDVIPPYGARDFKEYLAALK